MFAWRRAVSAIVIALFALALGVSAHAQLGSLLKKAIPKPASPVAPPPPARKLYCEGITSSDLDRLLKVLEELAKSRAQNDAKANAAKAADDSRNQARAQKMMAAMEKQGACEDAAKEKDPRYKEAIRLNDLSNAANDRGDESAGERYSNQAAALNDALDAMARKECTGDCAGKAIEKDPRTKEAIALEQAAASERNPERKAQLQGEAIVTAASPSASSTMAGCSSPSRGSTRWASWRRRCRSGSRSTRWLS